MKKLLSLIILLACLVTARAAENETLSVNLKDGTSTQFLLNEEPKITFGTTTVKVQSSHLTMEFEKAKVLKFIYNTPQMLDQFHIIRLDGSFSSFLCSEIKSIQFSKTDGTGTVHEKYVTQIMEMSDGSSHEVPISDIKEMLFDTPPIESSTYIDLGLSVKWASCNVGASSPEKYGGYYNWKAACKFNIPTKAQMHELIDNCSRIGTILNGVKGIRLTGPNGNSIFMPCAGYEDGYQQDLYGLYWLNTPILDNDINPKSWEFAFNNTGRGIVSARYVYYTLTVRTVSDTPPIESSTYIDLGLSVKWASCNAGASSPERYGNYYNWKAACKFNLPTKAQMEELDSKCTWESATLNSIKGVRVTGPNGNCIFMPYCYDSTLFDQGYQGGYWSSTPSPYDGGCACILNFSYYGLRRVYGSVDVSYEFSVRAVAEK